MTVKNGRNKRRSGWVIGIILPAILFTNPKAEGVLINEIMSSNASAIADEDGDFSDWIELVNPTNEPIDLTCYRITDEESVPDKWVFPHFAIGAGKHLVIFASDKNRKPEVAQWETIINRGDVWKYFVGMTEPSVNWRDKTFDDSGWLSGATGIGYGDGDDATQISIGSQSVYLRKKFSITDQTNIRMALLHIDFDDGFIAWLNGTEIVRSNISLTSPLHSQSADSAKEANIYTGGFPECFTVENFASLVNEGENVLAILVLNYGQYSSDLTAIPFLTLGMIRPPENPNGAADILRLPTLNLHLNFKISSGGETILLTDSLGRTVDRIQFGAIPTDVSYGRFPDGESEWKYFPESTPASANNTGAYPGIVSSPVFSSKGSWYSGSLDVTLTATPSDAVIHFTTDGSEPIESSEIFRSPIRFEKTTVLRANAFLPGWIHSRSVANTYFFDTPHSLPVVSISTNPANLWDPDSGIYVMGRNASPDFPYFGANFWQDWERPVHVEFFEYPDKLGFSIDGGVKIHGQWGCAYPQKSLAIFTHGKYGNSDIPCKLFSNRPNKSFQSFLLRNSGNDWGVTMFRDELMQGLAEGMNVELQAYRPAVVYLNGEYWGLQNLREKVNEHYLAEHFGVNPDEVDILENNGVINEGESSAWLTLVDFYSTHDLSVLENYQYVADRIDIDNFIDYNIAEIYVDNRDWPGNNVKFWRHRPTNSKWRWIVFDLDFGFGLFDANAYRFNTLEFALEPNGPGWPNPSWSTLLLRKLIANDEFRQKFINRFADCLNTRFTPAVVVSQWEEKKQVIEAEMSRHYERWKSGMTWTSFNDWYRNAEVLKNFGKNRSAYVFSHLLWQFNLSRVVRFQVQKSPAEGGFVKVNSVNVADSVWSGLYFAGIPITIKAVTNPGFRFLEWMINGRSVASDSLALDVDSVSSVQAVFVQESSRSGGVVINEFNYNSDPDFDPEDWVEIGNFSDTAANLSGWIFKDSDDSHSYVFQQGTSLAPNGFIVICRSVTAFHALFPDVQNYLGDFSFELGSSGEFIRLFSAEGMLVDSVDYGVSSPWPTLANGGGPTLALVDPLSDNTQPDSWKASDNHGTPGIDNQLSGAYRETLKIPKHFNVAQNFPNPFNNQTVIPIDLPRRGNVSITVVDVSGRTVARIWNGYLSPGSYRFEWAPETSVGSGLYFYRACMDGGAEIVRKMVLIK